MNQSLIEAYKSQIEKYTALNQSFAKKSNQWSVIRLVSFLVFIALIILLFQQNLWLGIGSIYLFAYLFVRVVRHHNGLSSKRDLYERMVDINEKEIKYLDDNHTDLDSGIRYMDAKHPYSSDLDLFGDRSLYQLLLRANTRYGKDKLAERLKYPLSQEEIEMNQAAVLELENLLDWRQSFYAIDLKHNDDDFKQDKIDKWLSLDGDWIDQPILKALAFLIPILSILISIYLFSHYGLYIGLLSFVPNLLMLKKYFPKIAETQSLVKENLKFLTQYNKLYQTIEAQTFESPKLKHLKRNLVTESQSVSKKLKRLDWYLDQLDMKFNIFGMIFNTITLWDLHFMRLLNDWKKTNGEALHGWLDTLGEFEFLCSMANTAYNNPEWAFPKINNDLQQIDCHDVGHPLLHKQVRIGNTIALPTQKHIKLITGSNMGGKSTFLRSIGLNLILSYTGSKVCATHLETPILSVISSMRTNDALKENTSGFYAELKKLKNIVDAVTNIEDDQKHYFLIDEVLKGTNSNDRHEGSKALIKQLLRHQGAGLISTHDLKLANLEQELGGNLENKCFEVEVEGEQLIFDYKIKDGISKSFNATHLMRNMGIDI